MADQRVFRAHLGHAAAAIEIGVGRSRREVEVAAAALAHRDLGYAGLE